MTTFFCLKLTQFRIGLLCVILCIALGIANIFHVNLVIIFSIICIVQGLIILLIEVPFLLKICPLTDNFTGFLRKFNKNWPRAGFYAVNALIQYLSCILMVTSLLAVAILLTIVSLCYALAGIKNQEFTTSSALGGVGLARQIL